MTKRTRRSRRSTSRSSSRRSRSSSSRSRRRSSASGSKISAAQLNWMVGLVMLGLALVTFLSFLSGNRGELTEWWIQLLARTFGWGMYTVPLALGLFGLWIITRLTEAPITLPWERVLGLSLLLITLLAFSHHLFAHRRAAALNGVGGGLLGYYFSISLEAALGWGGAIVVFIVLLAVSLTLAFDLSLEEVVADGVELSHRVGGAVEARRQRRAQRREKRGWESLYEEANRKQKPLPSPKESPPPPESRPEPKPQPVASAKQSIPVPAAPVEEQALPKMTGRAMAGRWNLPRLDQMLVADDDSQMSLQDIREKTHIIEDTLNSLGVPVTVVEVNPGPVVTQFGLEPGYVERRNRKGKTTQVKIKVSKISSLANDIALALAASPIRIEAPVPGKGIVGIEVPNEEMSLVGLRSVMESDQFQRIAHHPLAAAFGRDVSGAPVVDDLASLPHLLIAGATGSGKSVSINALIACLLCRNTPDDLRLLMVDPKRVELSSYNGIPHLIAPVVVDPSRVVGVLKWLAGEMDRRYRMFAHVGARNLDAYNKKVADQDEPQMPYIAMFIDELADLMMVSPDEVERLICRIAQLSRATGIHLVIATQRPSVDVVTGLIKANFPARLSFLVSSQIDSRVILDTTGAEKLLGHGDALYMAPDSPKLVRIQGCFVSDAELEGIISFWKAQAARQEAMPPASASVPLPPDPVSAVQKPLWPDPGQKTEKDDEDPLLQQAIDLVIKEQRASVSFLQRGLRIGYTRAARIIDTLEDRGIIGPATGSSKARTVRIKTTPET